MNMYIAWPVWLLGIIVSFGVLETYALLKHQPTLSRFVWELTAAWPPTPYIVGFIVGFLTCHFWWGGVVTFAPVANTIKGWL